MTEGPVSPELALVDPELAASLRATHVAPTSPVWEPRRRPPEPIGPRATADRTLLGANVYVASHGVPRATGVSGRPREAGIPTNTALPVAAPRRVEPPIAPTVDPLADARPVGSVAPATRRRWRPRPFEGVAFAVLAAVLGAAFLPQREAPTFAAPTRSGQITFAWSAQRDVKGYLLEITDGRRVVYERRLTRPYVDDVFALPVDLRYRWRVFALPRQGPASEPIARGSFVFRP